MNLKKRDAAAITTLVVLMAVYLQYKVFVVLEPRYI
jgi:hypothetical protein